MRVSLPLTALAAVLVAAYAPAAPGSPGAPSGPSVRADSVWTWPERSENLRVLPDSTSADGLRAVMESFTRGLGVRCSECHVGEGRDRRTWDFASDAKPHKEVARGMMRMTAEINADLVPEALESHAHAPAPTEQTGPAPAVHVHGDGTRHVHEPPPEHDRPNREHASEHAGGAEHAPEHAALRVSCWTCHRGQRRPETSPPAGPAAP